MLDVLDLGLALSMPGGMEWIVVLIVALLLFGKRLPEIMRGLGGSVKEFKKGMDEGATPQAQAHTQLPPPPPMEGAVSRAPAPQPPTQPNPPAH